MANPFENTLPTIVKHDYRSTMTRNLVKEITLKRLAILCAANRQDFQVGRNEIFYFINDQTFLTRLGVGFQPRPTQTTNLTQQTQPSIPHMGMGTPASFLAKEMISISNTELQNQVHNTSITKNLQMLVLKVVF